MMRLFDNSYTKLMIDEHSKLRNELANPILKDIEKTNARIESIAGQCMAAYKEFISKEDFSATDFFIGQLIGEAKAYTVFLQKNSTSSLDREYSTQLNDDLKNIHEPINKLTYGKWVERNILSSVITSLSARVVHFNTLLHKEVLSQCSVEATKQLKNLKELMDPQNSINIEKEEKPLKLAS